MQAFGPDEHFGDALIDRSLIRSLSKLWEDNAPLTPNDLRPIELGLRAFLTAKRLMVAPEDIEQHTGLHGTLRDYDVSPFRDGLLDYEFFCPKSDSPLVALPSRESEYLVTTIADHVKANALRVLHRTPPTMEHAMIAVATAYQGKEPSAYELFEEDWVDLYGRNAQVLYDLDFRPFEAKKLLSDSDSIAEMLRTEAAYYVRCHRAGLIVFGNSPLVSACNEFLFSLWPKKLFDELDAAYSQAVREMRGPGVSVDLPPLLAVVLNRASRRSTIPYVIRDMRAEYEQSRAELWRLLRVVWRSERHQERKEALRQLSSASSSIYIAAFPERLNVLSLGLGMATASFSGVGDKLLKHDEPRSCITAVSFAARLSRDLKKYLTNDLVTLKRHLSQDEQELFGLG